MVQYRRIEPAFVVSIIVKNATFLGFVMFVIPSISPHHYKILVSKGVYQLDTLTKRRFHAKLAFQIVQTVLTALLATDARMDSSI
jgi:hypothetical protein